MRTRTVRLALLMFLVSLPALFLVVAQISIEKYRGLSRGDLMPMAMLHTVEGVPVATGSWLGAPTLIVVFQPGCEACRREIDILAAIAPSFPEVHIALLSTAVDIGETTAPFPVYVDHQGVFLKQVRKLITPAIYWSDASGRIRYARAGLLGEDEGRRLFHELLAEANEAKAPSDARRQTP